jgi:hypothetical protein
VRKLIIAGILVLFLAAQSTAKEPHIYAPLPDDTFTPVIVDKIPEPTATLLPRPVPTAKPVVVIKPTSPPVKIIPKGNKLSGIASWYCKPGVSRCTYTHPSGGYYAAIRKDLLELMGKYILVCAVGTGKCVTVKIIDCNCGKNANLIDLYWDSFNAISNPSLGRVEVTLKW